MPKPTPPLPPQVADAIRRGELVEAIKLLRASGFDLRHAKAAVDALAARQPGAAQRPAMDLPSMEQAPMEQPSMQPHSARIVRPLPPDVLDALQRGRKIEAIGLLRKSTGVGLKEAKDWIDAAHRGAAQPMLAPGEVPRTGAGVWWLVAAILAAVVAWYFLR